MTRCIWCEAKDEINEVLEKYDIEDKGIDNALDYFYCTGNHCDGRECDPDECFTEDECPNCDKKYYKHKKKNTNNL